MITFRAATEKDYAAYASFHALLGVPEPPAPLDYWTERMAPLSRMVDRDGRAAAWLMNDRFGDWYFVTTIAVAPEFQGRGLGREIMQSAANDARAHGCTHWALNVKEDNARARRLYESLGMREHSREFVVRVTGDFEFARGDVQVHAANVGELGKLEERFNFLPEQLVNRGAESLLVAEKLSGVADVRGPMGPIRSRAASDGIAEALLAVGSGRIKAREYGVVINSRTLYESLLARGGSALFTSIQLRAALE